MNADITLSLNRKVGFEIQQVYEILKVACIGVKMRKFTIITNEPSRSRTSIAQLAKANFELGSSKKITNSSLNFKLV